MYNTDNFNRSITIPSGASYLTQELGFVKFSVVNSMYIVFVMSGCGSVTGTVTGYSASAKANNTSYFLRWMDSAQRSTGTSGGHIQFTYIAKPINPNAQATYSVTLYGNSGTKAPNVWLYTRYIRIDA